MAMTTPNPVRLSPGCLGGRLLIAVFILLAIASSAQCIVEHGSLVCYTEKYGWSRREVVKQDSVGTGYLEGVYQSTASGERITIGRSGDHYVMHMGYAVVRLDDIGLPVYPTTIGWAERWDRFLRVGSKEYMKVR